jgi:methionine biosynthesis protein MetW
MLRDREQFEGLWRNRGGPDAVTDHYLPGQNLRVDKALQTITNGRRLLDIGCGNGTFLTQLKGRFDESFGVDIAESAVNLAIQNGVQALPLNLNTDPLPYTNQFFDVITILSAFQYFYNPADVLSECHRVLITNGILLLSIPNMRSFWRIGKLLFTGKFPKVSKDKIGYDGGTLHYFCYQDMVELLTQNGFKIEWAHGIYCFPRFLSSWTNISLPGLFKREFFSAEIFIKAFKV